MLKLTFKYVRLLAVLPFILYSFLFDIPSLPPTAWFAISVHKVWVSTGKWLATFFAPDWADKALAVLQIIAAQAYATMKAYYQATRSYTKLYSPSSWGSVPNGSGGNHASSFA